MHFLCTTRCVKKISLALLLSVFCLASLEADIQSEKVHFHVDSDMIADGYFAGTESIDVVIGKSLKGSGYFESPNITIKVGTFEFTGTIYCDGQCCITAKEPFDENMFTRSGKGTFIITIDPLLDLRSTPTNTCLLGSNASIHQNQKTEKSKIFDLNGFLFTAIGDWNIHITEAIINNDMKRIRLFLDMRPNIKSDPFLLGILMLISGAYGRISLAEEFIKMGADVLGQDDRLSHPHLITAILLKQPKFITMLIKAGVNPNIEDKDATPALIIAVIKNDIDAVKALVQSPKIDLEAKLKGNQTALMYACYAGYAHLVEVLLQAGANPETKDAHGFSALDFALDKHHKDIVMILRQFPRSRIKPLTLDDPVEEPEQNNSSSSLTKAPTIFLVSLAGYIFLRYLYLHCYGDNPTSL